MVKKAEGLNACTRVLVVVFGLLLGLAVSEFGVRVAFNPKTSYEISTDRKVKGLEAGYFVSDEWCGKYDTMSGMQFYSKAVSTHFKLGWKWC